MFAFWSKMPPQFVKERYIFFLLTVKIRLSIAYSLLCLFIHYYNRLKIKINILIVFNVECVVVLQKLQYLAILNFEQILFWGKDEIEKEYDKKV